jgi:hypothetical protein
MDRPRLIRGLRIAVTAVCGVLCVLLIGLWVRSYHRDQKGHPQGFKVSYKDSQKRRHVLFSELGAVHLNTTASSSSTGAWNVH